MALERRWTLLIGALQGLLLLAAHEFLARALWPATLRAVVIAWYAVVIGVPVAATLLWSEGTRRRRLRFLAGLGVVLGALGAYAGYAAGDVGWEARAEAWVVFAGSVTIAWFVVLPFAALWIRTGRLQFPYAELFALAWGNALTLLFAAAFTGLFWALLALWAGLFNTIGIGFFEALFTNRVFFYPAMAVVFGFALFLGHSHATAVVTLRKVVLSALTGLLPLVSFMALLFLLFLPFTGLQPLWDTGRAAVLLLAMQVALILFLNAAWQDGNVEVPSHPLLQRITTLATVTLPVYSGLILHALFLRVAQYGWTGARVWAALCALIAALYALGYAIAVLARRARWMGPINVTVALIVVALLTAANTPLMDPMRIGAESQLRRLLAQQVPVDEFDYSYLRFGAGRYGVEALNLLAARSGDGEAATMRSAAQNALAARDPWRDPRNTAQWLAHVSVWPEGRALDPAFVQFLAQNGAWGAPQCAAEDCLLLALDLNDDGTDEYVEFFAPFQVFTRGKAGWRKVGRIEAQGSWSTLDVRAALERRNYGTRHSPWPNLEVGDIRYGVVEEPAEE